ncbi:transcriptoin antitermination RNA binding domain protein [Burkholderia phage BcepSauron]|uniref:Transcriptoin antitermination RNA binding domain protein n=1 Tax=Burkholderia phage BcepSauron TaxID=2530033 RepID=A0A482MNB0_9CAUD|nr:transcriptoin antitermination RNA binding domain protein [Burkholderia phage BcepSauron]QBQ74702.1 transcriptoin antitermination RNA binding domain protein [Burkholderia phage BcepSauron]
MFARDRKSAQQARASQTTPTREQARRLSLHQQVEIVLEGFTLPDEARARLERAVNMEKAEAYLVLRDDEKQALRRAEDALQKMGWWDDLAVVRCLRSRAQ